jgi:hypothetical protein
MYIFYFLHTGVKLGTKQFKKKIKQNNQHRTFQLKKITVTSTKIDSSHESGKNFITWTWPASTTIIYNNHVSCKRKGLPSWRIFFISHKYLLRQLCLLFLLTGFFCFVICTI